MTNTPPDQKKKRRRSSRRLRCAKCGDNMIMSPGDGTYCQNCLADFARWASD